MRAKKYYFFLLNLPQFQYAFVYLHREHPLRLSNVHVKRFVEEIAWKSVSGVILDPNVREQHLLLKHIVDKPFIP
jgi:hypothetical protein